MIPLLSWDSGWSQSQIRVTRGSCIKPIGRIVSSQKSRQFCKGEQINIINETLVICYSNQNFLRLQPGNYRTNSLCDPRQVKTAQRCTLLTKEGCPNRKGPGEGTENAPKIIQPYGKMLVDNRPSISWSAVPGANSYIVRLKSYHVNWIKLVNDTTLLYPLEEEELHYGNAIKFIVIAKKDNSYISEDTLLVHLLPERKIEPIKQVVQQLKSLDLPPDEVFVDLDAVYMSEGLLNETIEFLKAQVAAGSQNPTLYRILGDRYAQAWLPQQSVSAYTKAVELAAVQGKTDEEAIAKERLELLNSVLNNFHNQLPTRIKPDQ
ncbi:hypothetical protein NIES2109_60320 (plasmid) [Nostoc sp. HK-01]|nr:hypothetical protein NIES2109_60320 [Nostoc sp. HK-01]